MCVTRFNGSHHSEFVSEVPQGAEMCCGSPLAAAFEKYERNRVRHGEIQSKFKVVKLWFKITTVRLSTYLIWFSGICARSKTKQSG